MIRVGRLVCLPARDIDRAITFYTNTLGLRMLLEARQDSFAVFQGSDSGPLIGLRPDKSLIPDPGFGRVWIWLEVDDIASWRGKLESKGVHFLGRTTFVGPGYEAQFVDSEGTILRLFEPLQEVRRIVKIQALPAAVFRVLTDARAIQKWFPTIDSVKVEARVGGVIEFFDPLFGQVKGRIIEFIPATRVTFEFERNWPTRLEFTLVEDGKYTRLELHQTGFDAIRDQDFSIGLLVNKLEAALKSLGSVREEVWSAEA